MEEWIEIRESKPTNLVRVLVFWINENGHGRRTVAEYVGYRTVLAEDYLSDECSEEFARSDYDEEKDVYWTPEGFYESNYMNDINYFISEKVTHWMTIPKAPINKSNQGPGRG